MSSGIAKKVVAAFRTGRICPIYADEAETRRTPYAVYTIDEEAVYDLDGIAGWVADVEIALCASSFDDADALADAAISAMEGLRGSIGVKLDGRQPYESTEGKLNVVILSYTMREAVQ